MTPLLAATFPQINCDTSECYQTFLELLYKLLKWDLKKRKTAFSFRLDLISDYNFETLTVRKLHQSRKEATENSGVEEK